MIRRGYQNLVESGSKKKELTVVCLFIIACLGVFILTGYSYNGTVTNKDATVQKTAQESKTLAKNITSVYAESKPNVELEKTIIDYLKIPDEYLERTKYYYNYVDLNMDGADEIFVVVMGPYTSGSGGNTALHIIQTNAGMKVNQQFTLIQTPIIVSDKSTNGVKELIVKNSGGGATGNYVVLTCSDGQYKTVNEGMPIEGLEEISGKAIISNDMLKDMEEGKALYLQKK